LSIVHRLTERRGGTISVASELGQGSTFTLTFPHVAISVRLPESARVTKSERVDFNELEAADLLVVDDDASNRELLAGYFDGTHHRLRFATNGREALQRVREQQPAVVLMDIRMPEMDGRTALSELRKLTGTELLPVIAVTAASMIDDDQVLHGQFAGCLRKPFTRHALFQELAAFLPRRAQPAPAAASPGATAAGSALDGDGSGWPQLVPALRQLQATIWREASESGAINDVKEFAARIRRIGASGNCPLLTDYASALEREADDYAILRMETRLKDFPHLIHTVEFPAASPRPADSRSA
ncbi:MAG TPA: response regulator, partial [Opitutus sp.]|nr:response regulator [Opitutus sp.]